ncbi:MAG: DUF4388 domain-containing protein [Holophagaceae bacterium]|uniref:DUF4388 domain-containing protein n=1 Tax=Candidatus Geothrix skivensis TaxID=2954439 RepID=A0A9D7SFU0_9BACT|nr:DUF4388 domain-containing protein [Candidatus Geothrix skivensis]
MTNLRGNLESISLTDVAQLLHVNRKTGLLQVSSGRVSGVLYFSGGEVIHAETQSAKGESAAFEILEWTSGNFEFLTTHVQTTATIRRTIPDLLMDSARLQDSRKRLISIFPRMTAVPWPTLPGPKLLEGIKLFTEERQILPFFDGYRNFKDVMQDSGHHDVAVLQAAAILRDAGRLDVFEPDALVTVTTLKGGMFKKGDHLELPRYLEELWTAMAPYQQGVRYLQVACPRGACVDRVEFVASLGNKQVAIPRELMQAWELTEGSHVMVRPAPNQPAGPPQMDFSSLP